MGKFIDLTGQKFNRLTVINYAGKNKQGNSLWECVCECGNKKTILSTQLKRGETKSCGCFRKELITKWNKRCGSNIFDLTNEYGIGYTSSGQIFYFDLEDYNKIKEYKWYSTPKQYIHSHINRRKRLSMHRLIMNVENCDPKILVDHINRLTFDNRKSNLRICNTKQNSCNRKCSANKFLGVNFVNKKYESIINNDSKKIHLGIFETLEEALIVRLKAELKYFGEFAPQRHLFKQYGIE